MFKTSILFLENQHLKKLAEEVVEHVYKLFSKWSIVGSIMRGHPDFHDLDFLILKKEAGRVKKIPDSVVLEEGELRITIEYKKLLQVDFFLTTEQSWEAARIAWGYGKANLNLRKIAKEQGCKLNQDGLECKGKWYYTIDEIEEILGVDLPDYLKVDRHSIEELHFFDPNSTPHEGRHRLLDPEGVTDYRRWKFLSGVPYRRGVSYIVGKCKKTGKMVVQAVRFDKDLISELEAKEWFEANEEAIRKYARCPGWEWTPEDWELHKE